MTRAEIRPRRWQAALNADPLDWLLAEDTPAVRHLALRELCDRPADDPQVRRAQAAAMATDPIRAILVAQHPEGWWVKPGAGYSPKYRATAWQVIFLDQLGADPDDPGVRAGCDYLLEHTTTISGGFGSGSAIGRPPPSRVLHCLNGNLIRALSGLGRRDDPRVRAAIDWQARAITGGVRYHRSGTSGPGFCCGANDGLPCAWGAIKALGGLARVPAGRRDAAVTEAIDTGVAFLLSRDPAIADYPMGYGNTAPNGAWFKLGFPSGYVADVLQNLEVLAELGHGQDPRLRRAIDWILARQDAGGRWRNDYAYHGRTWVDFEHRAGPSKWVTLRVCRLLKRIHQTPPGGSSPPSRSVGPGASVTAVRRRVGRSRTTFP
jgi:hypothetical protein